MKVELKIDPEVKESHAVVYASSVTPEIQHLVNMIRGHQNKLITGHRDQRIFLLSPKEVFSFATENQRVIARTEKGDYSVKLRLYEIEEQLRGESFVRISNSVLANVEHFSCLEMAFNGLMIVRFKNGTTEPISRRCVAKVKTYLGI
ncbi:MAG: putative HTH-type transcriptional regulator [Firmicutes bacterium]|nr:putative HTH-type transcriptional regulator [candidate division NPL-UPA2 bacterium]MBT9154875.1 putative HTH-type transcriptional regulator [candidate division NPL-UPA2 bacterium]